MQEYNLLFIINEITTILKDNILIMLNNDKYLNYLKKYYREHLEDTNIRYTPNEDLIPLVYDVITDLVKLDTLYDFRNIE